MYIVVNKDETLIDIKTTPLWVNPAPTSQNLSDNEVWASFDPAVHKIIAVDDPPQAFAIEADGSLRYTLTLMELETLGLLDLPSDSEIDPVTDEVKEKDPRQKFRDGLIDFATCQAELKLLIKEEYALDILWTDDTKLWYEKLSAAGLNTTSDDAAFADAITYWREGYEEYEAQKTAIFAATTVDELDSVAYNPTHATPDLKKNPVYAPRLKKLQIKD